jgi:hypothetical protein
VAAHVSRAAPLRRHTATIQARPAEITSSPARQLPRVRRRWYVSNSECHLLVALVLNSIYIDGSYLELAVPVVLRVIRATHIYLLLSIVRRAKLE